jgi:hypothetical protein
VPARTRDAALDEGADRGSPYALNGARRSGGPNALSDSITGFRLRNGQLFPIAGSIRALSTTAVGPAQIEFTPDGGTLVVTEKNTNNIVTFTIDRSRDHRQRTFPVQPQRDTNTIGVFRIGSQGQLTRLPFVGGLPSEANGLAVR